MITDQIVIGVRDKNVRMQLLKATDLSLEKAIKICQTFESTRLQIQTFDNGAAFEAVEVDAVRIKDNRKGKDKVNRKEPRRGSVGSAGCNRCGNRHAPKQCPAFGKDCRKCGGKNHFAKGCFSKNKVQFVENKGDNSSDEEDTPFFVQTVILGDKDTDSEEEEHHKVSGSKVQDPPVYVDCMEEQDAKEDEWIAKVDVNGTDVSLKLDTGAQVNILPLKDFYRLKRKFKVHIKKVNLRTYDDKPISTKGVCRASLSCNGKNVNAFFVLDDGLRQPLLGLKACIALGLIKRVHISTSLTKRM